MPNRPNRPKAPKPKFQDPQHFTYVGSLMKWYCNICSIPSRGEKDAVSAQAAMKHEKSASHRQKLHDVSAWGVQPDLDGWINADQSGGLYESKLTERMDHVDQLGDIIPFWRQQVEAANHGVDLRFEDFLNSLAQARKAGVSWDAPIPDWAAAQPAPAHEAEGHCLLKEGDWPRTNRSSVRSIEGAAQYQWLPAGTGPKHEESSQNDFMFVEEIALRSSVDQERKERLHAFYKISTDEKIEKIEQLIRSLKST